MKENDNVVVALSIYGKLYCGTINVMSYSRILISLLSNSLLTHKRLTFGRVGFEQVAGF
jgi:hypothetical protein